MSDATKPTKRGSARKKLLEILTNAPKQRMELTELAIEMSETRVLGFGVRTVDVVYALERYDYVIYDRTTDTVSLIPDYMREFFRKKYIQ